MFNPDGSEFERSGNGLRILAAYLYREARVSDAPFEVTVGGDLVRMTVHDVQDGIYDISVEMGQAKVGPDSVGLNSSSLDGSGQILGPDGSRLHVIPVSVGNPHLVVFVSEVSNTLLESIGPFLATHSDLSNGANVQLVGPLQETGSKLLYGSEVWVPRRHQVQVPVQLLWPPFRVGESTQGLSWLIR